MRRRDLLVGVTEARTRLRDLLDEVVERDVVILKRSRPVAVLTDPARLERLVGKMEDLEDYAAALESKLWPGERLSHEEVRSRILSEPSGTSTTRSSTRRP